MSRWKVAQHIYHRFWVAYPAAYDSEQPESNMDDDLPRRPLARGFRTWREAMEYADRMTRTREYVLPRLGAAAIEVLSKKGFIPYSLEDAETIALSMLAYRELAEQEES